VTFEFFALRFHFRAKDSIFFAPGKSGNILRGAFGTLFQHHPAYKDFFEPAAESGPSGYRVRPRPFVFRAAHLDGRVIAPGEDFHFDVHVFSKARDYFRPVFQEFAEQGIGPGRGRVELVRMDETPVSLDLTPGSAAVPRATVAFLTPTELKGAAGGPEFPVLFARARDRVSALRAFYGPGPLEIDFHGMGERAAAVRMARCEIRWDHVERKSSRTGQTHPLGGFTGEADYEGGLAAFLPILRAAEWTGVGRHTVWGNGHIVTSCRS
jgi:hypothetical protein